MSDGGRDREMKGEEYEEMCACVRVRLSEGDDVRFLCFCINLYFLARRLSGGKNFWKVRLFFHVVGLFSVSFELNLGIRII